MLGRIPSAKFRRESNTVITPFKTHRADFKVEEDRGKIEGRSRKIEEDRGRLRKIEDDRGRSRKIKEDRGNYVFFCEPFLGKFRDAGVCREFLGRGSVRMDCVLGPGFAFGAEPPTPPCREIYQSPDLGAVLLYSFWWTLFLRA